MAGTERRQKMLPIGIENFEEIRTDNFYYVDKTAMIRDLLYKRGKVNLFTRPRRFGKSLNMSMLKYFFEIGSDRSLFDGLDISKETELCEQYMGRFPVISISLKSVNGADFETARSLMCGTIGREAMRFQYLLEGQKLTDVEKKQYEQLINVDSGRKESFVMSDATLMGSLKILSDLLYKYYGEKVIILIDEYDVPLAKANEQGYYDQMVLLIRNLFEQALKTNDSLYFAVLTGCLRVSRESIFTGLNNMKVLSILSVRFDEYFGFTDDEVKEMLEYYQLSGKYEVMKSWYDGYQFGNVGVYCPWDVISYCDDLLDNPSMKPRDYWSNTSSNDVIRHFLEMAKADTRDEIERLIAGECVLKTVREELTYKDLYKNIENVWSILFTTGYLTQRGENTGGSLQLAIPNGEILNIFMTQIREWMDDKAKEDGTFLNDFCAAFEKGDAGKVQQLFSEYLGRTISVRDTAVRMERKEGFYHGILLGLLRYREDWKVLSNRESGDGYADIVVEEFNKKFAVVVEVKYAEDGNLEAGCQKAILQINDRQYVAKPESDGMQTIIKCGFACHGKDCRVVFE